MDTTVGKLNTYSAYDREPKAYRVYAWNNTLLRFNIDT